MHPLLKSQYVGGPKGISFQYDFSLNVSARPNGSCYYYFALANTSNYIRFQTSVAEPGIADVLLHISSSLPSFTATMQI